MKLSQKHWQRILTGLSLLCLLTLVACSSAPVVRDVPPARWYAEDIVAETPDDPLTNGKLVKWIVDLTEALRLANADRAALRAWAQGE